jgi:cysteine desulfurase
MQTPVYLDYHATTPADPRVVQAMLPYFSERFGNPGSAHAVGRVAAEVVATARTQVAELIGASADEIIFTSGGTEATSLALFGAVAAYGKKGKHVITQPTEHKSVLGTCAAIERAGGKVTRLPVDGQGRVDPARVREAITAETVLVSLMWLNNEIGTVQPIAEIAEICRSAGVLFYTDAAQAAGKVPIDLRAVPADLLSLSAHKLYGPKGIGALYVRKGVRLLPHEHGGGQERGLRPGTLNVPAIVGFGEACRIAREEGEEESERLRGLRDRLWRGLERAVKGVTLNGDPIARHPGNVHVSFDAVDARELLALVPELCLSLGSACTSGTFEPSHVVRALGLSDERMRACLRVGVGRFTTEAEVDYCVALLAEKVGALRSR